MAHNRPILAACLALGLLLGGCATVPEASLTPAPEPSAAPSPEPSAPAVYTDWSQLTPYAPPQVKYTRRYEGFTDHLIPAEDYGALVPFAGASLTRQESWSGYHDSYPLYGLVTLEGEVVTDPVFTSVFTPTTWDAFGQMTDSPPVYLLSRLFPSPGDGEPEERTALCAMDGSWCTGFDYLYDWEMMMSISFDGGIPLLRTEGGVAFLDPETGREFARVGSGYSLSTGYWTDLYRDPETGWVSVNYYDWEKETHHPQLFDPQGTPLPIPREVEWVGQCGEGFCPARVRTEGVTPYRYGYLNLKTGRWAIEPTLLQAEPFFRGVAAVDDGMNSYLINSQGTPLTGGYSGTGLRCGERWYFMENSQVQAIFDAQGNPVDSPLTSAQSLNFERGGWISAQTDTEWLLVREDEVHSFPRTEGWIVDFFRGRLLFCGESVNGKQAISLLDLDGGVLLHWEGTGWGSFHQDRLTGKTYLEITTYSELGDRQYFYDLDGRLLFSCRDYVSLRGGLLSRQEDGYSSLTDPSGSLIFGWSYPLAED